MNPIPEQNGERRVESEERGILSSDLCPPSSALRPLPVPLSPLLFALEAACLSWCGTPFCENSAVKGAGVCCHLAVGEAYREAGLLPPDLRLPLGPAGWSRTQGRSLMEAWLDEGEGRHWFVAREPGVIRQSGDLLGFRVGHCVHHLAIQLDGGRLFHAVDRVGASIAPNLPPAWAKRLARVWRPNLLL